MRVKDQITEILRVCADDDIVCTACPLYDRDLYDRGTAACYEKLMLEAADAIESKQKRIAELEAALREQEERRWIPVKERLPDQGDSVLCFMKFWEHRILQWDNVSSLWLGYGHGDDWQKADVTNWMPLPEPPKGCAEG